MSWPVTCPPGGVRLWSLISDTIVKLGHHTAGQRSRCAKVSCHRAQCCSLLRTIFTWFYYYYIFYSLISSSSCKLNIVISGNGDICCYHGDVSCYHGDDYPHYGGGLLTLWWLLLPWWWLFITMVMTIVTMMIIVTMVMTVVTIEMTSLPWWWLLFPWWWLLSTTVLQLSSSWQRRQNDLEFERRTLMYNLCALWVWRHPP